MFLEANSDHSNGADVQICKMMMYKAVTEKLQNCFLILQTTSVFSLQQWICQMDESLTASLRNWINVTFYWDTVN